MYYLFFFKSNYELIRINFGALNLRRPSFTVDAREVILHPNFDKTNTLYEYDIGLIKLPFKLDERGMFGHMWMTWK